MRIYEKRPCPGRGAAAGVGHVWEWCDDGRMDERTGESRDPVMRGGSGDPGHFIALLSPMILFVRVKKATTLTCV